MAKRPPLLVLVPLQKPFSFSTRLPGFTRLEEEEGVVFHTPVKVGGWVGGLGGLGRWVGWVGGWVERTLPGWRRKKESSFIPLFVWVGGWVGGLGGLGRWVGWVGGWVERTLPGWRRKKESSFIPLFVWVGGWMGGWVSELCDRVGGWLSHSLAVC